MRASSGLDLGGAGICTQGHRRATAEGATRLEAVFVEQAHVSTHIGYLTWLMRLRGR